MEKAIIGDVSENIVIHFDYYKSELESKNKDLSYDDLLKHTIEDKTEIMEGFHTFQIQNAVFKNYYISLVLIQPFYSWLGVR